MGLKFQSSMDKDNLKPLLTSLNGDNSWLVSIPRPLDDRAKTQKAYFHIVSDAWLDGPANTFHPWLISIHRTETAAAKHGADVEAMALDIETAAGTALSSTRDGQDSSLVDLILINTNGHDHLNEATLKTFSRRIPVLGVKDCVAEVLSLRHFDNVTTCPDLVVDQHEWQSLHPGDLLPPWLHIFRIGTHFLNFATAIAWKYGSELCEAILYSPHGLRLNDAITQTFLRLQPRLTILALLHALHDSFAAGRRTTLGVEGGLALHRATTPKYWVPTHDQVLIYQGIVMKALRVTDVPRTLESAIELESRKSRGDVCSATRPNIIEVGNGSCFALE